VFIWIWAFSVCISRLINGRHYLLDVVSGIGIGFLEAYFVSKLWLSSQKAENMFNVLFDDIPEI
jgi:membrane-associated phospholipid phosphatase